MKRKDHPNVEVTHEDLKALIYWAEAGVGSFSGGCYMDIVNIIPSYAKHIGMKGYQRVKFGEYLNN